MNWILSKLKTSVRLGAKRRSGEASAGPTPPGRLVSRTGKEDWGSGMEGQTSNPGSGGTCGVHPAIQVFELST